MPCS